MRSRRLNGNPFGTRGSVIATPFSFWMWRIGLPEGALYQFRRAGARCAGVVRRPVVQKVRCAEVVRRLVVLVARYAGRDTEACCADGPLWAR